MTRLGRREETIPAPAASGTARIVPIRIVHRPVSKKTKILLAGFLVAVIAAIITMVWLVPPRSSVQSAFIEHDKYQAVYLVDDTVYFGKLNILSDGSARLTNVYYPQRTPEQGGDAPESQTPSESSALVKFGSELLGGEDQIVFNKTQVAYWLNLKPDSKVTKAINNHGK